MAPEGKGLIIVGLEDKDDGGLPAAGFLGTFNRDLPGEGGMIGIPRSASRARLDNPTFDASLSMLLFRCFSFANTSDARGCLLLNGPHCLQSKRIELPTTFRTIGLPHALYNRGYCSWRCPRHLRTAPNLVPPRSPHSLAPASCRNLSGHPRSNAEQTSSRSW
jgi:hypothetical protein